MRADLVSDIEERLGSTLAEERGVPEVSRFHGIVVAIYYNDHAPPHFHARYESYEITVGIMDGVVVGRFPRRALGLVVEWYTLHQTELLENWNRARERQPLIRIEPLE